jgi:hypothetical protein
MVVVCSVDGWLVLVCSLGDWMIIGGGRWLLDGR